MSGDRLEVRRLGELFVEKGLITEQELEEARREHERTGKLLTEILVARDLVSEYALAATLAQQVGRSLEEEESDGSGLWGVIGRRRRRTRGASEPSPRTEHAPSEEEAAVGEDAASAECVGQAANDQLDAGSEAREEREPEREGPMPAAVSGEPERAGGRARLLERDEEIPRLLAEIESRDTEIARLRPRLAELSARLDEAMLELGKQREQLTAAERELTVRAVESEEGGPAVAPAMPARFLLFVPQAGRYALLEGEGPPPSLGSEVLLGEPTPTAYVVCKLAGSPLPLDDRPCAYLVALR